MGAPNLPTFQSSELLTVSVVQFLNMSVKLLTEEMKSWEV